jgi:putative phage-type endonuclease
MDRTKGLGGSDMAAILGIDRFRSALDVYLEKIGEAPAREETEAMFWGTELEDNIARRWADRNGLKVRRKNVAVVHPDHPWMRGHIDRMVVGKREGVEIKLSSADGWGDEDTDQIPHYYLPQVHHYLTACPGVERWHVVPLLWSFGPPKLAHYLVERDDEMSGILIEAGERFLKDHVEARVAPDPETNEQAGMLWRKSVQGKQVLASEESLRWVRDLEAVKLAQKELKAERDHLELAMKGLLREADTAVDDAGKVMFSWKEQSQSRFNQKSFKEECPTVYAEHLQSITFRKLHVTKLGKETAKEL